MRPRVKPLEHLQRFSDVLDLADALRTPSLSASPDASTRKRRHPSPTVPGGRSREHLPGRHRKELIRQPELADQLTIGPNSATLINHRVVTRPQVVKRLTELHSRIHFRPPFNAATTRHSNMTTTLSRTVRPMRTPENTMRPNVAIVKQKLPKPANVQHHQHKPTHDSVPTRHEHTVRRALLFVPHNRLSVTVQSGIPPPPFSRVRRRCKREHRTPSLSQYWPTPTPAHTRRWGTPRPARGAPPPPNL